MSDAVTLQPRSQAEAPFDETASAGPVPFDLSSVLETLCQARRRLMVDDPKQPGTGRWKVGNVAHGNTGTRSQILGPETDRAAADVEQAIVRELGGPAAVAVTLHANVRTLARAIVLEALTWDHLVMTNGPISTKGRRRPVVTLHAQLSDRVARLSQLVGLERRAKPTNTLDAWLHSKEGTDGE